MIPNYSARNNDAPPEQSAVAVLLPLAAIDSSPLNPRKHFDNDDLRRLADSLEADGLLQPIVVTLAGDRYVVVAGERRWRAAQRLGWTEIAAVVRTDLDAAARVRLALLENLARSDLNPLEEADGYRQLQDLGMTQQAIAAAVHRSQPAIANAIRLLRLPQKVLEWIQVGQLSPSHGVALLRYESVPQLVELIAAAAIEKRWTSHELEDKHGLLNRWEISTRIQHARGLDLVPIRDKSEWGPHPFVRELCRGACPFGTGPEGSYRKLPDGEYCLRPKHYQELAAAVKEAAQKAAAKERDRLKATAVKSAAVAFPEGPLQAGKPQVARLARDTSVEFDPLTGYGRDGARGTIVDICGDDYRVRLDGGKVIDVAKRIVVPLPPEEEQHREAAVNAGLPLLSELPSSVVALSMSSAPYPCQDHTCPCLGQALDAARRPIFVCTKGRRHQQLLDEYDSKRRGQNGLHRLEAERVLDRSVHGLEEIGTREMALLAHIVSRSSTQHFHGDDALLTDSSLVTAANRNLKGAVEGTWRGPEIRFDKLADVTPLALVRFGMEAVLRTSIERYYATGGDTLAKWYFGKGIPDFLGHGWRPPRDGDATSPAGDGPAQPTDDVGHGLDEI